MLPSSHCRFVLKVQRDQRACTDSVAREMQKETVHAMYRIGDALTIHHEPHPINHTHPNLNHPVSAVSISNISSLLFESHHGISKLIIARERTK